MAQVSRKWSDKWRLFVSLFETIGKVFLFFACSYDRLHVFLKLSFQHYFFAYSCSLSALYLRFLKKIKQTCSLRKLLEKSRRLCSIYQDISFITALKNSARVWEQLIRKTITSCFKLQYISVWYCICKNSENKKEYA